MRENDRIIVGLINHSLSQEQLASIATKAVKEGDIFLAELAFAQIENQDAILKLYKGRLLSLKGDFKNFIEYSNTYADSIQSDCRISDALSPWYWRQGISFAVLNQLKESDYAFDKMKSETNFSLHELAHYYQCYGAVKLYNGSSIDKAQELLINSMTMYLKNNASDEPLYSLFDNFRCIIVNLIMQAIIDLQQGNTHIAYRKMQYCREWVHANAFSRSATGMSEISTLFKQGEWGWVFDYIFSTDKEYVSLSTRYINNDIMLPVINDSINYQSLKSSSLESSIKAFNKDYLTLNNFPKEKYRKCYYFHMEDINMRSKKVFIIHGRNANAYSEFVSFLTSLRLDPIEWDQAIRLTGKPSPYIGEVIDAGFKESQAIIVLLTPDEKVELRRELQHNSDDGIERYQSRPNVIFEAGAALSRYPQQTFFIKMGEQCLWSDIDGRDIITISNNVDDRRSVINRLVIAGCPIDITASRLWITQGDLDVCN